MMLKNKKGGSAESGPAIGTPVYGIGHDPSIPTKEMKANVLLFVSMHCTHCIDLLPHIEPIINEYPGYSFQLFSTGNEDDNQSMIEYFGWEFPVIALNQSDMHACYEVTHLPFMILANQEGKVTAKGVVYNADDFGRIVKDHIYELS